MARSMLKNAIAILAVCGCTAAAPAAAQAPVRIVNPEALDFDIPSRGDTSVTGYRVELFLQGTLPGSDAPVKSIDVAASAARDDGTIRVQVDQATSDLPDGTYVAALGTVREDLFERGSPGDAFVIARGTTPAERAEEEQRNRKWTRIAMIIGAAILVVPFLF
jgi:hypothetical protein